MRKSFDKTDKKDFTNKSGGKKSATRPKGKRPNSRNRDNVDDYRSASSRSVGNDPEWYNVHPDLVKDSASIWFNRVVGTKFHDYSTYEMGVGQSLVGRTGTTSDNLTAEALPGFMMINFVPGPGAAHDAHAPINLAANALYTQIRIDQSGAKNYEAPDLMMYMLAMDEVVEWWANLVRIYGLLKAYTVTNNYFPKLIISALGYNFNDLEANLANFHAHINMIPRKVAKFYIPGNLNIFKRHVWMNQALFTDSNTDQAQFYMFRNNGYRVWDDTTGSLHRTILHEEVKMTFADIINVTNTILAPIEASGDFAQMASDVRRTWGDKCYVWSIIPEDYVTPIVYDPAVLAMIENARIVPVADVDIQQHYSSDPNRADYITYEPELRMKNNAVYMYNHPKMMNFHTTEIQPLDIMYASRFISTGIIDMTTINNSDNDVTFPVKSCGAELLTGAYIYKAVWKAGGTNAPVLTRTNVFSYTQQMASNPSQDMLNLVLSMRDLSSFNQAPQALIGTYVDSDREICRIAYDSMQYDVATPVSNENVDQMNEVAMISLWDFPSL